MVMGNNKIDEYKKYVEIAGRFDDHVDVAVQCRVHRLMAHIPGFTRSRLVLILAGSLFYCTVTFEKM